MAATLRISAYFTPTEGSFRKPRREDLAQVAAETSQSGGESVLHFDALEIPKATSEPEFESRHALGMTIPEFPSSVFVVYINDTFLARSTYKATFGEGVFTIGIARNPSRIKSIRFRPAGRQPPSPSFR